MARFVPVSAVALLLGCGLAAGASAATFDGFFAGVQVGDTFGEASQPESAVNGGPFVTPQNDYNLGDVQIGAHAGYNWLLDGFLIGAVVDYNFINTEDADEGSGSDVNSFHMNSITAVRARAGWFASEGTLLYVTGGGAWIAGDASVDFTVVTVPTSTAESHGADFGGYTYGLGAEFSIAKTMTFGVEWRRYEFDRERVAFTAPANAYDIGIDPELDTIQLSFSYYFGELLNQE